MVNFAKMAPRPSCADRGANAIPDLGRCGFVIASLFALLFAVTVSTATAGDASDMVRIQGGTFLMGSAVHYREEGAVRRMTIGSYLIARTDVTTGLELRDMMGNVWEHVLGWWVPAHPGKAETDPDGPPEALAACFSHPQIGARRVVTGGSWLCAPAYCVRYRPTAPQPAEHGLGSNHIGFRIAMDAE